jgi:septum formation protein
MSRHQRQRQDQLVLKQRKGIKVPADDQHISLRCLVHGFGSGFIGHKQEVTLNLDRFLHRPKAALALQDQADLRLQGQPHERSTSSNLHHPALQTPVHLCRGILGKLLLLQTGKQPQGRLTRELGSGLCKGREIEVLRIEGFAHARSVRESLAMNTSATALPRTLVLGSTSPYRRELLARLHLPFEVAAPEVDETPLKGESPRDLALRLALLKAQAVAAKHPQAVVIGADQVADLGGQPLGKPGSHAKAVAQLREMRGQSVVFQTALAVVCQASGFEAVDLAPVRVQFRNLTDDEIEHYLLTEKPYDCAGSAKSEGLGIALLEAIENDDPTALVGLPLIRTARLLRAAGVKLL